MFKRTSNVVINGLLLVGLVGLLVVYFIVVNDLPSRIYTAAQREYLSYNLQRNVAQIAPTWNFAQVGSAFLAGQKSRIQATLTARYEQQEGVSVTLYDLDFRGEYNLAHPGPVPTTVELIFPFPKQLEDLHQVRFLVDGEEPPGVHYSAQGIRWQTMLQPGEKRRIVVNYRANGANDFAYGLHHGQRSDVDVTIRVVGLRGSAPPTSSLPPTAVEVEDGSETFTWEYEGLITERDIQLDLPLRLSFTQRVAQLQNDFRTLARLAPFLVGLFLAALAGVLYLEGLRLRLEVYLLVGCSLALFYPTLTFLSGVVDLALAAILAVSFVSGLLLVFLGLTAGWRRIGWRVGLLLGIFLGVFSLGVLTPWRGLLLTSGGLLLVSNFMLLYTRRFSPLSTEIAPDETPASSSEEMVQEPANVHCPFCARALMDDYDFCPGCGHDTGCLRRCVGCGSKQFVPAELEAVYCIHCGRLFG